MSLHSAISWEVTNDCVDDMNCAAVDWIVTKVEEIGNGRMSCQVCVGEQE